MGLKPRDEMIRPRANSLIDPDRITFHVEKETKRRLKRLAEKADRSLDAYMRKLADAHATAQSERGVI